MYGFVLLCGWALTAAVIALVWIGGRPNRTLPVGLLVGVVAGVLWPITLWIAVGAWIYQRACTRAGNANAANAASLESKVREAEAFARQADLENMPSSAAYWRAEAQRLAAQRAAAGSTRARPAATGGIVIGCTVASLVTVGVIALTAPPAPTVAEAADNGGVVAPPRRDVPQQEQQIEEPERTKLGNVAKGFGETAAISSPAAGTTVLEFIVGEPAPAQCRSSFAPEPENGNYISLPISVRTYDDPNNTLVFASFASRWEFVAADGRSFEASTTAAAMCGYEAPTRLGPNRTYEFSVVLDVPPGAGALVLPSIADNGGWEWTYGG